MRNDREILLSLRRQISKNLSKIRQMSKNLSKELSEDWSEEFDESLEKCGDISKIWPKFAIFLLTDASQCNSKHEQCKIVADFFQRELNGEIIDWEKVAKDAYAAAYDAFSDSVSAYSAYAASASASASAAYDDASAASSAYSAYAAAAYDDASAALAAANASYAADPYDSIYIERKDASIKQSEKLLELLKEV